MGGNRLRAISASAPGRFESTPGKGVAFPGETRAGSGVGSNAWHQAPRNILYIGLFVSSTKA